MRHTRAIPLSYVPNRWDAAAFLLIFSLLALGAQALHEMHAPLASLETSPITLSAWALPEYSLRTVIRMLAAMAASLLFTVAYGTLAAKNRHAERLLVPALDILQSVPVLGFLSFSVLFFLRLFPGSLMGAECVAIFAIFTSQAWNMAFSFYQSLKTLPVELVEVSHAFRFTAWQRFWRLEVPFALPGLVWNMMISMSGGWFFVVASEAITVGSRQFILPGIGSYVAQAIAERNVQAILQAVAAMALVITAYDQLLFRPLVAWAEKFRFQPVAGQRAPHSWLLRVLEHTRLLRHIVGPVQAVAAESLRLRPAVRFPAVRLPRAALYLFETLWSCALLAALAYGLWRLYAYLSLHLSAADALDALQAGLATLTRVFVLIALASLLWVPVGVWIGLRPKIARRVQPLTQALAAFPANLLFPAVVMLIVRFDLNPDIALSPLLILGTQWYILFNVIAGAAALPADFRDVSASFSIRGQQWWRQVMIPAILPYYITGALAAAGGAWNASVVAEMVSWGDQVIVAHGLGAYIAQATQAGDYPRIVLGIAVMSLLVILCNRLLWRRLQLFAETRLRLG